MGPAACSALRPLSRRTHPRPVPLHNSGPSGPEVPGIRTPWRRPDRPWQVPPAFGFFFIRSDQRRQFGGERDQALYPFANAAELFVELHIRQLRQIVGELGLQIALPEELRIRKARADHLLVARDDQLAIVRRATMLETSTNLLASLPVIGSFSTKHFWLTLMVS